MKKINILLIAFCVVFMASCADFLDVPPTSSVSSDISISTPDDAKVVLNGIMSIMTSSNYYGRNFIMYGDTKGGDLTIESQGRGLDGLYTFNHAPTSGSQSYFWTQIYYDVLQVNTLIKNIDRLISEGNSSDNLTTYKGQALTLRALMYFDLVRLYGKPYNMEKSSYGVPVVIEPVDASSQPTRESVEAVYTQIIKDLTEGASLIGRAKSNGFINYYGNMALQAKVNLYMENYSAALSAAETVINSGVYTLYSNDAWVNSWKSQFGSESIFELAMVVGESDLTTGSLGIYLRRAGHGSSSATGQFIASDSFIARLAEDPDDVRHGVMTVDTYNYGNGPRDGGSCYKYCGGVNLEGDGKGATSVNIKVIRLSEVYLIAAEAALGTNNSGKAADYLNQIRKRSPNLAPATAANVTVDLILNERSKELFAEGHRFFDMMRLNKTIEFNDELIMPQVVLTHRTKTINRTFFKTILPIPSEEIDANPAIKDQQNPGY
ncbi:MAG: RagB/SusD family nutrient uptake outer membrane protein [Prevotellaceae bacterium]|jgi:hypothetical protein|nr:RagB/SusD family nutrient uptake outer membrane protein [Prevotellaceae bacterium]